jgi:hypothetical protein
MIPDSAEHHNIDHSIMAAIDPTTIMVAAIAQSLINFFLSSEFASHQSNIHTCV